MLRLFAVLVVTVIYTFTPPILAQNSARRVPRVPDEATGKIVADDQAAKNHADGPMVTEGKIPVMEFIKFIQYATGKPVLYPSAPTPETQFGRAVMVDIIGDISPITLPIVESILETNGYTIHETKLEDDSEVIIVRHSQSRNRGAVPQPTEVYTLDSFPKKINHLRLATLSVKLKNVDTNSVIGALRDHLGVAGRGSAGTATIVAMSSANTLLITAKMRTLDHMRKIIATMDAPSDVVFEVIQVEHARATRAASVVREFFGSRPMKLVADDRSGKIFIEAKNRSQFELARKIVAEVDTDYVKHEDPVEEKSEDG